MALVEQMANIGSEVSRALNWRQKNNTAYSAQAAERALELLDLSLDSVKGFSRLKEFARVREAVVDIDRGVMAVDAQLHSDLEALLLEEGSKQKDLWGINLYPEIQGDDFVEFDSMINMRPSQGNRSRGVENAEIRKKVAEVVGQRVAR